RRRREHLVHGAGRQAGQRLLVLLQLPGPLGADEGHHHPRSLTGPWRGPHSAPLQPLLRRPPTGAAECPCAGRLVSLRVAVATGSRACASRRPARAASGAAATRNPSRAEPSHEPRRPLVPPTRFTPLFRP